jgi:hypothetical protein
VAFNATIIPCKRLCRLSGQALDCAGCFLFRKQFDACNSVLQRGALTWLGSLVSGFYIYVVPEVGVNLVAVPAETQGFRAALEFDTRRVTHRDDFASGCIRAPRTATPTALQEKTTYWPAAFGCSRSIGQKLRCSIGGYLVARIATLLSVRSRLEPADQTLKFAPSLTVVYGD